MKNQDCTRDQMAKLGLVSRSHYLFSLERRLYGVAYQ